MSDRGAEPHSSSPGARLSVARAQAGLSATQAAERLHLDTATLDALESGRFEGLGASVFVRGHLRRYAELVNVPEAEIMAAYDAWSGRLAAQPDLRNVITAPAARSNARSFELRPRSAVIGAIVLVPVALIWWAVRMPAGGRLSVKAPAATPIAPAAVPAAATPAATPASVPIAAAAPAPTAPSAPAAHLTLAFTQASWLEVYDANGAPLYHGLALTNSQHRVVGSPPLRVFLGNPMGVTLELDGRPVEFTGSAARRLRHFLLDSGGRIIDVHAAQNAAKAASSPP
jgi:cytoskeleton protein RodZ